MLAAVLVILVPKVLPASKHTATREPTPVWSLIMLSCAVATVSIAGILPRGGATAGAILLGVALLGIFVLCERRGRSPVLPMATYRLGSSLKWVYLTVWLLVFGIGVETFAPLFGQRLGDLPPLIAGFLGAAMSLGWSLAQIPSSNVTSARSIRWCRILGPVVLALGLVFCGVVLTESLSTGTVLLWIAGLVLAGAGVGLASPHLTVAAMDSSPDKAEGAKAAAGVNTVLLIANSFSAATAGLMVNLGEPSTIDSARYLFVGFAIITVLGTVTSVMAIRRDGARNAVPAAEKTGSQVRTSGNPPR